MFLGKYTISDCDKLVSNYDTWIPQLGAQFLAVRDAWGASNPSQSTSFRDDLQALITRWQAAKAELTTAKNRPFQSDAYNYVIADNEYQDLIKAVHQGGEGSPPQEGDFQDLTLRLQDYLNTVPNNTASVSYSAAIQSGPDDPDSALMKNINGPLDGLKYAATTAGIADKDPNGGYKTSTFGKVILVFGGLFVVGYAVNTVANLKKVLT